MYIHMYINIHIHIHIYIYIHICKQRTSANLLKNFEPPNTKTGTKLAPYLMAIRTNPFLPLITAYSSSGLHPGCGYPTYISAIPPGFIPTEFPYFIVYIYNYVHIYRKNPINFCYFNRRCIHKISLNLNIHFHNHIQA
jgi:hypothetical protein